jgi:hypothetical protein
MQSIVQPQNRDCMTNRLDKVTGEPIRQYSFLLLKLQTSVKYRQHDS